MAGTRLVLSPLWAKERFMYVIVAVELSLQKADAVEQKAAKVQLT